MLSYESILKVIRLAPLLNVAFQMFLVGAVGVGSDSLPESELDRTSRSLFGDLWQYDQYCGDSRSAEDVLEDDVKLEKLINGSALSLITSQKDANHQHVLNQLDQLNALAVRSRLSLSMTCSLGGWGYADNHTFSLSNGPLDDASECRRLIEQLDASLDYLLTGNGSRADPRSLPFLLRHLSSNARTPAGPIYQSHIWPGDYKTCTKDLSTRYCFGAYKSRNWPTPTMRGEFFRVGLCLPSSCNSRLAESQEHLQKIDRILKHNLVGGVSSADAQPYELIDLHCPPTEDSPIRQQLDLVAIALIGALVIWLSVVAYATLGRSASLESFNASLNWAKFTRTSSKVGELDVLNGLKVIVMYWVISTHLFLFYRDHSLRPLSWRDDIQQSLLAMSISQGQHAIPMYFIISGFLCGRKYIGKQVNTTNLVLHRYLRLMPMYFIAYCYVRKFTPLTGSGPLWDYGVSPESDIRQCQNESWLVPILMLANFIPPFSHCILTGWHIANDFQIFLTLPLLLGAYGRSRRTGRLAASASFLLSHLYHVWIYHSSDLFAFRQLSLEPINFGPRIIIGRLAYDYVNPFGRIGSYHLGILLADLLSSRREADANGPNEQLELAASGNGKSVSQAGALKHLNRPASDNNTAGRFKDTATIRSLLMVGLFCLALALLAALCPPELKGVLGAYSKALAYPLTRLFVELGWFLVLYALLQSSRSANRGPGKGRAQRSDSSPEMDMEMGSVRTKTSAKTTQTLPTHTPAPATGFSTLLSLPIWNVLVKLHYTLILFHFVFVRYLVQTETQLLQFSWLRFGELILLVILLSYSLCALVHVAIEMPLSSLLDRWQPTSAAR